MTSLTIIIPFLKETPTDLFEGTLLSILENRPENASVLVVNAAGYDNCYDISADEGVDFLAVDPETSLIEAINIGVQHCETSVVHPILCGCQVEEGWADSAVLRFETPNVAAVIPTVRIAAEDGTEQESCGAAFLPEGVLLPLSSRTRVPSKSIATPFAGGAFFRRETLLDLGLFEPKFGLFAFADMAILIAKLKRTAVFEKNSFLTYSAETFPTPDRSEWITAQERLYRRFIGTFSGAFGLKRKHAFRLWKEKLAAAFGGAGSLVGEAYRRGSEPLGTKPVKAILSAARSAIIARRKKNAE